MRSQLPPLGVAVTARRSSELPLSYTLFTTWKTRLMLTSKEMSFKAMLGQNIFLIYEFKLTSLCLSLLILFAVVFIDMALAFSHSGGKANVASCVLWHIWWFFRGVCPHGLCWLCCSKADEGCFAQEQFIQSAWKSSAGILVRVIQAHRTHV